MRFYTYFSFLLHKTSTLRIERFARLQQPFMTGEKGSAYLYRD